MKHKNKISRRGLMFVLSSPSGAGKSTLAGRLLKDDDNLVMSVSVTTRAPRPGEVAGEHYHFIDLPEFKKMVEAGELLEHAEVFSNHYGTPRPLVERELKNGRDVLFDVDWQGAQQLSASARSDLVSVFILPPTHETLEVRLRNRAQDPEEVIALRMSKAMDEMSHYAEYDYIVVNDDLATSRSQIHAILTAERLRRERQVGLPAFVNDLCGVP